MIKSIKQSNRAAVESNMKDMEKHFNRCLSGNRLHYRLTGVINDKCSARLAEIRDAREEAMGTYHNHLSVLKNSVSTSLVRGLQ